MFTRLPARAALALLACSLAATARADVLLVTNTANAGSGSLRSALNTAAPGDSIHFAIPEAGVQTISPTSPLPPVPVDVTIDGTTQIGASCAAWPPTLLIEIEGGSQPSGSGLTLASGGVVRGLVLNSFPDHAVRLAAATGARVECNFIGTDATGTQDYGNGDVGVDIVGTAGATVGGNTTAQRNLISANAVAGVSIDAGSSQIVVAGNYIGTDVTGDVRLDNFNGVLLRGADNTIGGVEQGNLISGNTESGVRLDVATATGNEILANRVGPNASGTGTLPNGGAGVYLLNGASDNVIGTPLAGNRFEANGANAVYVFGDTTLGNSIRGNSMSRNGDIGIDLGEFFETPNDPGDPDVGPNRLQNTPVLLDVTYTPFLILIELTATFVVSTDLANATYPLLVDFYRTDLDFEEGEFYLGTLEYDAFDFTSGEVTTKRFLAEAVLSEGDEIVATATDAEGNTSEFSEPHVVDVPEPAALASGVAALLALGARRRRAARS